MIVAILNSFVKVTKSKINGECVKFVRLRKRCDNAIFYSNANKHNIHEVIVTTIDIMAGYDKIRHDNDYGDDNLMRAHMHLNRK